VYSVIIRANDGTTFVKLPNEGGADEVWFDNPTTTSNSSSSFHYFLAEGGCTSNCGRNSHQGINRLGIIDLISVLGTETSDTFPGGQDVFIGFSGSTTRRAHSVGTGRDGENAVGTGAIIRRAVGTQDVAGERKTRIFDKE
jgi:hypothetical protein